MEKPQLILVMRHAKKPLDPTDPDLSPAGQRRAERLAAYIPEAFGQPDFIFAAARSKRSERSIQTVRPLAARIQVPIQASIADEGFAALSDDLLSTETYYSKRIVICWHHGLIPSMMRALGAASSDYPNPWDPEVFDLILKVDFGLHGPVVSKVIEHF